MKIYYTIVYYCILKIIWLHEKCLAQRISVFDKIILYLLKDDFSVFYRNSSTTSYIGIKYTDCQFLNAERNIYVFNFGRKITIHEIKFCVVK